MDKNDSIQRAEDLAHAIATSELLRFLLSRIAFNADVSIFRGNLQHIEDQVVASLGSRRHFPAANDYTDNVIKEMACAYVTRLIASIRHPDDPTNVIG
jgi:hypothetical protein